MKLSSIPTAAATLLLLGGCASTNKMPGSTSAADRPAAGSQMSAVRSAADKIRGQSVAANSRSGVSGGGGLNSRDASAGGISAPPPGGGANAAWGNGAPGAQAASVAENLEHGVQAEMAGRLGEARWAYERVIEQDPKNVKANHRLATIADREGRFPTAEQYYFTALQQSPHDSNLLSDLGYSFYLQGKYDDAEKALQESLRNTPNHRGAISNLGTLYARQGDRQRAYAMFSRVGTDAEARNAIAQIEQQNAPPTYANSPHGTPPNPFGGAQVAQKANPAAPAANQFNGKTYPNEATRKIAEDMERMRLADEAQALAQHRNASPGVSAPTPWNGPPTSAAGGNWQSMAAQERRAAALAKLKHAELTTDEVRARLAQVDAADAAATRANRAGRVPDPQGWPNAAGAPLSAANGQRQATLPPPQGTWPPGTAPGVNSQPQGPPGGAFAQNSGSPIPNGGQNGAPVAWPGTYPPGAAGSAPQAGVMQAGATVQANAGGLAESAIQNADWTQTQRAQVVHADETSLYDPALNATGGGAPQRAWENARNKAAQVGFDAGGAAPFPIAGNLDPIVSAGRVSPGAVATMQPAPAAVGAGSQNWANNPGAPAAAAGTSASNAPANWNVTPPAVLPTWPGTTSQGGMVPSPSIPSAQAQVYGAGQQAAAPNNLNPRIGTVPMGNGMRQADPTGQAGQMQPQLWQPMQQPPAWNGSMTPQPPPTSFPQPPQ